MAGWLMDDYLLSNKPFDYDDFKQKFTTDKKPVGIYKMFESIIKENKAKDKIKNAEAYRDAMRSLSKYKSGNLAFAQIDSKFLKGYESHLFDMGVNGGGANHYMRTLRACYREAIKRGYVQPEQYPIKSQIKPNGYTFAHLKSKKQARPISTDDFEKLKSYPRCFALNLFLFSYYCGGINLRDIALMTRENIYNYILYYTRSKTNDKFSFILPELAKELIPDNGHYLFPILNDLHQTMQQKQDRLKRVSKEVNKKLKSIAQELEINAKVTFYTARHTMASVMLNRGIDTRTIQQVMGHTDLKTTQVYLDSLKKNGVNDALAVL